ncbi:4-alpha-glucanotransferase [Teredinibacter waterburyi]|uniref:4-alpha-glucanotransferase n=1 Tax=Teredinibacter waterburyi TaxID=1500538 RepID=UPI00165F798E|nr:4-alpha-glucanotransferase [Teredinibacter waterburyi]
MSDLDRLFYWRGIAADYNNYRGEHVQVPLSNRLALLAAMGLDASTPKIIADAAFELDVGPWKHFFPELQTCVLHESVVPSFYINLHPARLSQTLTWELFDRGGRLVDTGTCLPSDMREVGDYQYEAVRYSRRQILVGNLDLGYYAVRVTMPATNEAPIQPAIAGISCTLALAPSAVYQPAWVASPDQLWGFIVQLYTLRTSKDWGIGDFSDLRELIELGVAAGVDLIGLNPVHALMPDIQNHCSPYSPSDRRFINPLYIDPTIELDFADSASVTKKLKTSQFIQLLAQVRDSENVDYTAVKQLKYQVFELMFDRFLSEEWQQESVRAKQLQQFQAKSGIALQEFALYEAVHNRWQGARYLADISPEVLAAGADSDIFITALKDNQHAVLFHVYIQWMAHLQLGACQALAVSLGMKVGLVRDLAVGADGGGAEAASRPLQFCRGASVGAPPDPLAEQGQNWGLPPMDPAHLRATGYSHFIEILRENMSACGALRIDHAMSLMRLWWCPPGSTADKGAYVYYPFEDMLAILCLESHLNKCTIIGEDLGVVPQEFRDAITAAKIFTNRVFYFEREHFDAFKSPFNYDRHALAMVNNHDVPTLSSWWDGSDLRLRDRLNIFEEGVDYQMMVEQRSHEKHMVFNLLSELGNLPDAWQDRNMERGADFQLISAILVCVASVSSRLYVIQLEDLLLMAAPVNVPGTYQEYPNWQRKIAVPLSTIFTSPEVVETLQLIDRVRRSNLC